MRRIKAWIIPVLVIVLLFQCIATAETGWVEQKDGTKFLFSAAGKKVTGWYLEGGNWYCLKKNGMLADGWVHLDTGFYHADPEGHIDEGWQKYKGIWYKLCRVNTGTEEEPVFVFRWYYMDGSADLPFGKQTIAGKTYYIENSKAPLKGWTQFDGAKSHFNEDGTADTGWKEVDGELYFFDLTGRVTKGQAYIEGSYFTFDAKGILKDGDRSAAGPAGTADGEKEETSEKPAANHPEDPQSAGNTPAGEKADSAEGESKNSVPDQGMDTSPAAETNDAKAEEAPDSSPASENKDAKPEEGKNDSASVPENGSEPAGDEVPAPVVTTRSETLNETIPYETEYRNDDTRFRGEPDLTVQDGQNGTKTSVYSVTYTDGVETGRVLESESITTQPVSRIISVGVKEHDIVTMEETVTEEIPFETEYVEDNTRSDGEKVTREGINGVRTRVYTVEFTDGVETGRTLKSDEVTAPPVNRIISVGSQGHVTATVLETATEEIPFETEYIEDNTRYDTDDPIVTREGVNGVRIRKYTVTTVDGVETGRTLDSESVTDPVNRIISLGTKKHVTTTMQENASEEIPFETEFVEDSTRYDTDGQIVTREGVNGVRTRVYTITMVDGVETGRTLDSESVTEPVNRIVSVGTKKHEIITMQETVTEEIPYETEYVEDSSRSETDGEIVTREGVNGVRTKVYTVVTTDGVETGRTLESDEITTQPVNRIISRGTKKSNTKNITVTEEIPYETEERDWPTFEVGDNVVAQEGVNGVKEIVYKVTYDDAGNEVSREKVSENITKQPQSKIVCVGSGVATYDYEVVPIDLSPWMHGTRSSSLDAACQSQAMTMAKNGAVAHTGQTSAGESVGGWSSASAAASGVASHGGESLMWASQWGAGCVKVTKHTPDGHTVVGYYACAAAGGEPIPHDE